MQGLEVYQRTYRSVSTLPVLVISGLEELPSLHTAALHSDYLRDVSVLEAAAVRSTPHPVLLPPPFQDFDPEALDTDISRAVGRLQEVVEMGRAGRERKKAPMKLGLRGMSAPPRPLLSPPFFSPLPLFPS